MVIDGGWAARGPVLLAEAGGIMKNKKNKKKTGLQERDCLGKGETIASVMRAGACIVLALARTETEQHQPLTLLWFCCPPLPAL